MNNTAYLNETTRANKLWNELENQLLYEYRFWPKSIIFDAIEEICYEAKAVIEPHTQFYRARIFGGKVNESYIVEKEDNAFKGYDKENSFVNMNKQNISVGRANPQFIPYLYIANSEYTALVEVRPIIDDVVSMAVIINNKELVLVDIREKMCLIDSYISTIRYRLAYAFSKPTSDKLADYIITQCISEYIRRLGFDGIMFSSSLHYGGTNITVFNYSKCEAISSTLFQVHNLVYNATRILPHDDLKPSKGSS